MKRIAAVVLIAAGSCFVARGQDFKKVVDIVVEMESSLKKMIAREEAQRKTEIASLKAEMQELRTTLAQASLSSAVPVGSTEYTAANGLVHRIEALEKRVSEIKPAPDITALAGQLSTLLAELKKAVESSKQPSPAVAQEATPQNPADISNSFLKISGFVDAYYSYNFQQPASRLNQLRNFDIYENQFSLNLAKVKFEQEPTPVGFHLEFTFGPTADLVHTIDGKADETFKYIHQAYATVGIPVGNRLTVDVGKFVTHLGAEVIETNANWNYSRSLLFAWAIPYFHTGIRLNYPLNDNFTVMGMVANGWNRIVDNNMAKTLGAQVAWTPVEGLTVIQNWISGAEQAGNNIDQRTLWDAVIVWQLSNRYALNVNFDYGYQTVNGAKVLWRGLAGMLRYTLSDNVHLAVRGEWFDDRDGFQTGAVQRLQEVTFTSEWRASRQLLLCVEFRHDRSNVGFFETKNAVASGKEQNTMVLGTVVEF